MQGEAILTMMAKHNEAVMARVRAEQARTNEKLVGREKRAIKQGAFAEPVQKRSNPIVIQKKPSTVINVISGAETAEKVERATEPTKEDIKQGFQKL